MDDIDREIKSVQLRREQLALEREIANERLRRKILAGPESLIGSLAATRRGVNGVILAWWKPVLAIALVASFGIGGFALLSHRMQQAANDRERIVQDQYHKQLSALIEAKCGRLCSSNNGVEFVSHGGGECGQNFSSHSYAWCRLEVESLQKIEHLRLLSLP